MDKTIILGLIQNTAILLAFSMIYDYSWLQTEGSKSFLKKIIAGVVIGSIGIILMLTPWKQVPGLVFDTRSVLLSLTGLFFGFIPTFIAVIITGTFRAVMGGVGIWMGLAVIVTSSSIGLLWRRFNPIWNWKHQIINLALIGYAVHITMLGCAILLPSEKIPETIKNIVIPLLTIYPAGTVLLGILMIRQLTNWKNNKASEKLAESDRRFSEMLNHTLLFSVIIDSNGVINFCNDAVIKASGYSRVEIIGKNIFDNFIPEESSKHVADLFHYILTGETGYYNYETELKIKDGSRLNVSWNSTVLKDEYNSVTGVACIGENITMRKQAEKELIRAKNKAEESDNLKSVFLANMSHEIRTPMNAIMGFSNLLGEPELTDSEKTQYIRIIRNSGDRLLQIINDIIDISKLDAKQFSISLSECNLDEIFRNSFETCLRSELLAQKQRVDLIIEIPDNSSDLIFVSDYNRFQQVLDNLLVNAVKYTPEGKIEMGYNIIQNEGENMIRVFVKDTGIGIPENMEEMIFGRFRQVEEGRFHEGAGLGLSISKGIVNLLGGKIWFESRIGKGTTFYFTVPYIVPEKRYDTKDKKDYKIPDLKGKSVIIAEDDYNSFYYIKLLVEEMNAKVIHAENGLVLMDLLSENVPDLILLDINMPLLSGFECLDKMKVSGIKTRVIAQTAYAMEDEKDRCISAGCNGYIAKPIKKSDFMEVVNSVMHS
jgi:PAS domain S-box-containing protein